MGEPGVKTLLKEVIGSTTLVMVLLDDSGLGGPFAYDVFPGPCRLVRADLTNFRGVVDSPRTGYLKLYDNKEPRLGLSIPDFVVPVRVDMIGDNTAPILIPGVPFEGFDFSVGLSCTATSEGGTGGIEGSGTPGLPVTLILTELTE